MIESRVIIIGGGPAGSSCARELVRAGMETLVLDRKTFPRPKVCAGWITPRVLRELEIREGEYPHGMWRFSRLHCSFFGKRIPIPTRQYAIRRIEFDDWLLKRSGAEVHQHKAAAIRKENGRYVIDNAYRCQYLVGAGGTHCPVHRTFFEPVFPRNKGRLISAVEEEFPYNARDLRCYLWFFENKLPGYAWYVPKANGFVNVGVGGTLASMRKNGRTIRDYWEELTGKLASSSLVQGRSYNPKGLNYYLHQPNKTGRLDNAFVVGDSAGLATLDMGEGIGPAIMSGKAAARAIIHGIEYRPDKMPRFSLPGILFSGIDRFTR